MPRRSGVCEKSAESVPRKGESRRWKGFVKYTRLTSLSLTHTHTPCNTSDMGITLKIKPIRTVFRFSLLRTPADVNIYLQIQLTWSAENSVTRWQQWESLRVKFNLFGCRGKNGNKFVFSSAFFSWIIKARVKTINQWSGQALSGRNRPIRAIFFALSATDSVVLYSRVSDESSSQS